MISLDDAEMQILMDSARPLQPHQRSEFLQACAAELSKYPEIGPGIVGRVCSKLQRQHLNGPRDRSRVAKWSR